MRFFISFRLFLFYIYVEIKLFLFVGGSRKMGVRGWLLFFVLESFVEVGCVAD